MDGVFLHIHLEQHQKKEGEEREEDSSKKSGISSTWGSHSEHDSVAPPDYPPFFPFSITQMLLLLSNFNSEQYPTAAWWGAADG